MLYFEEQKGEEEMNQGVPSQPKKSNTWLIIVIVLVVLCCICVIVGGAFYQYGDQILRMLGITP
jgi:flagellar basal body-associated protein FliL